jgi:hypothetical protein
MLDWCRAQHAFSADVRRKPCGKRACKPGLQLAPHPAPQVFLATWNETLVAVKLLLSAEDAAAASRGDAGSLSLPPPAMEELQKEAGLMASLRHPNVVLFLGVCTTPPALVTGAFS